MAWLTSSESEPARSAQTLLQGVAGLTARQDPGSCREMSASYTLPHGRLDLDAGSFHPVDGEPVALTERELALCRWLADRPGQIVSRQTLLTEVWGYAPSVSSRAVDYTIFRLRAKIEPVPTAPVFLRTLYGQGYRLDLPAPPGADRWRPLVGSLPVLQAAVEEALAAMPEEAVEEALRQRGLAALSETAHRALADTCAALPEETRRLLERLSAFCVLTPSVIADHLRPPLVALGRLQAAGLLLREGEQLCVPAAIRRTLIADLPEARRAAVLGEHARWLEAQLAAHWPVGDGELIFDLPVPALPEGQRARLRQEAASLAAMGGTLLPRAARLLTCHTDTSIHEALTTSRMLQALTDGADRWDLRAREARILELLGEVLPAAGLWATLAEEAEDAGWVPRALAARAHRLRLDPDGSPDALQALQAEADARGATSTSYFTRLWTALRGPLPQAEVAAVEAIRIARQQGSRHHETIALVCISGLKIRQEQPAAAIPHLRRAVRISTELHRTFQQAQAGNILALCLAGTGDLPEALRCAKAAVDRSSTLRSPGLGMTCWSTLAALLHTDGQLDEALSAFIEADSRAVGSPHRALVCALKASVEAELGEIYSAEASLAEAPAGPFAPFAALAACHIALSRGDRDAAVQQLAALPEDTLLGSPLRLDFQLARQRLQRRLSPG